MYDSIKTLKNGFALFHIVLNLHFQYNKEIRFFKCYSSYKDVSAAL
jgi:alpha-N-acetylglucosamine transferase